MSDDIVERLRDLRFRNDLQDEAADTIETLRRELATAKEIPMKYKRMEFNAQLQNKLAAEQAYSTRLREALQRNADYRELADGDVPKYIIDALTLPHDDTTLKQYGAKLLRDAGEREDEVERARRLV